MIHAVLYTPSGNKNIIAEKGKTLMEILSIGEFSIESPCGGRGTCGKCTVKASGTLSPVTAFEKSKLSPEMLKKGYRLSCLATAEGDIEITVENPGGAVIETDFTDTFSSTKPEIRQSHLFK